jgi:HSP20 family molecular chaperone IbpA
MEFVLHLAMKFGGIGPPNRLTRGDFIMALPTRVQRGSDQFDLAQHEFDNMVGRMFGSRLFGNGHSEILAPFGVDVREDADHIIVEADVPGFKKEEIDINLENQMLTIQAEHKAENDQKGDKNGWLLRERRYSRFERSFTLPPTVDPQTVLAKLNDGVLTVTLNKRAETKPRRVAVS